MSTQWQAQTLVHSHAPSTKQAIGVTECSVGMGLEGAANSAGTRASAAASEAHSLSPASKICAGQHQQAILQADTQKKDDT